jgi:hypothetical protein
MQQHPPTSTPSQRHISAPMHWSGVNPYNQTNSNSNFEESRHTQTVIDGYFIKPGETTPTEVKKKKKNIKQPKSYEECHQKKER